MKNYYLSVEVVEKRLLRVDCTFNKLPTKEEMLKILNHQNYNDITDEESLRILEVNDIELLDQY